VIAKQHRQIQENHHTIEARERQLRELNQQQEASEKVTAELQQCLLHRDKLVKELQEKNQHLQQELQFNSESNNKLLRQPTATQTGKLKLNWKTCKEAPCRMQRGSAAVLGRMAYLKQMLVVKYRHTIHAQTSGQSFQRAQHTHTISPSQLSMISSLLSVGCSTRFLALLKLRAHSSILWPKQEGR